MAEINNWKRAAGSNTDNPPDGAPEGMPPGDVNNVMRENMAVLARWFQTISGLVTATGSGSAYVVTYDQNLGPPLTTGRHFSFIAHEANAASATVNVNSIGATPLKDGHGNDIPAGDIAANTILDCIYDGTNVLVREVPDVRSITDAIDAKVSGFGTLTDGGSIAWNVNTLPSAQVTLGGNRTLATPTNPQNGSVYVLVVKQDATGSRTLSYSSAYDFGVMGRPILSTDGGDFDILSFLYLDSKMRWVSIAKGYS